jgi:hypothetical protein
VNKDFDRAKCGHCSVGECDESIPSRADWERGDDDCEGWSP